MIKKMHFFLILSLLLPIMAQASGGVDSKASHEHAQTQPKDRRWKTPPSYLATGLKKLGYATGAGLLMNYAFDKHTNLTLGINLQKLCASLISNYVFPDLKNPNNPLQSQQLERSIGYIGTAKLITSLAAGSAAAIWAMRGARFERTMHRRKKTFNELHKDDPYGAISSNREHSQYWEEIPSLEKIEVALREPTVAKKTAKYALGVAALATSIPAAFFGVKSHQAANVQDNSAAQNGSNVGLQAGPVDLNRHTVVDASKVRLQAANNNASMSAPKNAIQQSAATSASDRSLTWWALGGVAAAAGLVGAWWGYHKSFSKKTVAQIVADDDEKAAKALIKQHHYIFDVRDQQGRLITDLADRNSKVGTVLAEKMLRIAKKRNDAAEVQRLMQSHPQLHSKKAASKHKQVATEPSYFERKPHTTLGGTTFHSKYDQRNACGDQWKPIKLVGMKVVNE